MSTTSVSLSGKASVARLPSTFRIGLSRGGIELKQFFRQKTYVVFTFAFPAFLLLMLGSIFNEDIGPVSISQVFAASMIGAGIVSTTLVNLGTQVSEDRYNGTLKRLHGTPMPAAAYFLGKTVLVLVASVAEVVLLLALGMLMFDVSLPTDPQRWLVFCWVFLLAVASCSLLGIAISALAQTPTSAAAITQVPFTGLSFISGVYIPISQLPDWMVNVASVFPVRWIAEGFRYVFLPESMGAAEPGGDWQLGVVALVLVAWIVVGLVLCLMTFRWTDRRSG